MLERGRKRAEITSTRPSRHKRLTSGSIPGGGMTSAALTIIVDPGSANIDHGKVVGKERSRRRCRTQASPAARTAHPPHPLGTYSLPLSFLVRRFEQKSEVDFSSVVLSESSVLVRSPQLRIERLLLYLGQCPSRLPKTILVITSIVTAGGRPLGAISVAPQGAKSVSSVQRLGQRVSRGRGQVRPGPHRALVATARRSTRTCHDCRSGLGRCPCVREAAGTR
jgi:hypothetical protein